MAIEFDKSQAAAQWKEYHANQMPDKRRPQEEWTLGDFAIDQIGWLDSTVINSGWSAVLAYSGLGDLEDIISSLKAMGAHETLGIIQKCLNLFPAGALSTDPAERQRQVLALSEVSEEDDETLDSALDLLNKEYYASTEDLCALVMQYWESTRRN